MKKEDLRPVDRSKRTRNLVTLRLLYIAFLFVGNVQIHSYGQTKIDSIISKQSVSQKIDNTKSNVLHNGENQALTDYDKIFWTFIFSAFGIGFGWFLNQSAQWFRTRIEDKKNLKQVLFNQLELYFHCSKAEIGKVLETLSTKMIEKFPKEGVTEETKAMIGTILVGVEAVLKEQIFESLKDSENKYQESIMSLAKIDPITAYYLSGRMNIVTKIEAYFKGTFDKIQERFPNDATDITLHAKNVYNIVNPNLINETLLELQKDAITMAWKINPVVWYRTRKILNQIEKQSDVSQNTDIDDMMNKIVSAISVNIKANPI